MRVKLLLGALLLITAPAWAQDEPYKAGVHYFEIDQAQPPRDHVEVLEAFSYLCSHCGEFEPFMQSWKARMPENVVLRRLSVGFGRATWELYAQAYVTAVVMGIEEESHPALMDAIWKERKQMRSLDELADFYTQFGVGKDAFLATARSFSVDAQFRRDQGMVRAYGINGTPSMVVNGRYRVASGQAVPSFEAMLQVVDFLVAKELAKLEPAPAAATETVND